MKEKSIIAALRQSVVSDCYCLIRYANKNKTESVFFIRLAELPETSVLAVFSVYGYNYLHHQSEAFTIALEGIVDIALKEAQTIAHYREDEKERFLKRLDRELLRLESGERAGSKISVEDLLDYYLEAQRADKEIFTTSARPIPGLDIDILSSASDRRTAVGDKQFDALLKLILKDDENVLEAESAWLYIAELSIKMQEKAFVVAYHHLRLDLKKRQLFYDPRIVFNPLIENEDEASGTPFSLVPGATVENFEATYRRSPAEGLELLQPTYGRIDTRPSCLVMHEEQDSFRLDLSELKESLRAGCWPQPLRRLFGLPADDIIKPNGLLVSSRTNPSQRLALARIASRDISYIFGPPGTGKSHTIVDQIFSCLFQGQRLLVAANANHPLDEVAAKLDELNQNGSEANCFLPYFRVGTVQRMAADIDRVRGLINRLTPDELEPFDRRGLTGLLGSLASNAERFEQGRTDLAVYDLQSLYSRLLLKKIGADHLRRVFSHADLERIIFYDKFYRHTEYKTALEQAVDDLRKMLRSPRGVQEFLDVFPVVISTCYSTAKFKGMALFDLVFLDEAASCPIIGGLYALRLGRRAVLSGDQKQLNSFTAISKEQDAAIRKRLAIPYIYAYSDRSILDLLLANYPDLPSTLLRHHYRCQADIIQFCNENYYGGQMVVETSPDGQSRHLFVLDVVNETQESNVGQLEIDVILEDIDRRHLLDEETGIITPFVAQVKAIRHALQARRPGSSIAVGTVHSFQGDQKQNIYFSLAVSSQTSRRTLNGFVSADRLVNVAVSRAVSLFVAVGDFKALRRRISGPSNSWNRLVSYSRKLGTYQEIAGAKLVERSKVYRAHGAGASRLEKEFRKVLSQILSVGETDRYELRTHVPLEELAALSDETPSFHGMHFDFVIKDLKSEKIVALELDGEEHYNKIEKVLADFHKTRVLNGRENLTLLRIENRYLYQYVAIKNMIEMAFSIHSERIN